MKTPVLTPSIGRLVVEPISEDRTPSGLYLPSTVEVRATVGRIVAVPEDYQDSDYFTTPLSIGKVVLFGANSGMSVDIGHAQARRRVLILRESEVLAIITDEQGEPYA